MNSLSKVANSTLGAAPGAVVLAEVDGEDAGQRLDNFLMRHLKGVP